MHSGFPSLVGRRAELAAMRAQLDVLAQGRGGTVLAVGEAGAGKSALLRSVFTASEGAYRLLWAAGDELSQVFPLLPFLAVVDKPRRSEISALLRGGAAVADPSIAATEELVAWLGDLCAEGPVVLVFDDLHWADPASVRLWHRLALLADQIPLLVVGSMRPVTDRRDLAALAERAADRASAGLGVLAELTPLSAAESAELVSALVGGTPGVKLAKLVEAAGGNPLYLTELTGALLREGAVESVEGVIEATADRPPGSLSSVIATRLDAVPEARDLLRLAALLGTEFELSDLAVVTTQPVSGLLTHLDRARSAGVLTGTPTGMAFRHPLIREVLCEQVPAGTRAAWHREVGRALARAGQPPAAVARQLLAAIESGGDIGASDWLIAWLVENGETLANQSATAVKTLFAPALSKVPLTDPRRAAVALPLAAALLRANDLADAEHIASQTLENVHGLDPDTKFGLRSILFECRADTRYHEARAVVDQLESDVDLQARHGLHIKVLRARVAASMRLPSAERIGLDALELAERTGDPQAAAGLYGALALNEKSRGNTPASLAYVERGMALVADDPAAVDLYLYLLACQTIALVQLCEWERARVSAITQCRLAERTGNARRLHHGVMCDVGRMFFNGKWDDLMTDMEAMTDESFILVSAYQAAAVVAFHRDDPAAARRFTDTAERILARNPSSPLGHEYAYYVRGLALEHAGDPENAFTLLLDAVLNVWTVADIPVAHIVGLGLRLGRRADAEKVAEFAEAKAISTVRDALVPHCQGLIDGDPDLLGEAASAYRAKGLSLGLAMATEAAGLAWASRGDNRNARRAMTESLNTYEELGAAWDIARSRAAFRAYGMRAGPRGPRTRAATGWQSLTAMENKITGMVAEGLSNREIAEQLFLSHRTVETHMSHILQKLHLRSRVEVAKEALGRQRPGVSAKG